MPSNKELVASIKELDSEQETEGKSNQELSSILATLQAAKADADAGDSAQEAAKAKEATTAKTAKDAEAKANRKKPAYYVAPGKAITTKRGIISGDDPLEKTEIRAGDLPTGADALKYFIKTGHVLKGG